MNDSSIHRSSYRIVGVVVAVTVVGIFASRHAADVRQLLRNAGSIDPRLAVAGLLLSALAMTNRGLLNRAAHRAVGLDAGIGEMTQTAAAGFAAQKLVKSAGAAGLAVFVRDGRRRGHAPGTVAAACVLAAASSFVALGVLVLSAIGLSAATGRLTGWWILAAVGFGVYTLAVAAVVVAVVRNRDASVRLWTRVRAAVNRRRRRSDDAPEGVTVPTHLFEALDLARTRFGVVRVVLLHGVASKVLGASMLVVSVAAAGLPVSPTAAVLVYATALGASMVTIVPGGVGAVEGSTTALLVASGAPAASAVLAVVVFRFFDLLVPVVVGAAFARGRRDAEPSSTDVVDAPEVESATTPVALAAAA